ncbi:hypothetical protein GGS23DRAFT_615358 [Durotheca rogersii]|uniref:uncharacterized protein n=1 Tax=Durotheca rogersii TaxID=419775 RepID=UPI00221EC544|nr:uncharacterized protein GGS23DRAFT_615358 [Durotheca rogersii]KAI5866781.1 hypothetical protein GGS23DRAFT_615358 [Durotheca rogersii]
MRTTSLLAPLLAANLAAASPVPAESPAEDAPAAAPRVVSITYSGKGCPSASPGVERSGGDDAPSLRLNAFEAQVPGAADAASVHCQAHLQLQLAGTGTAGWQAAVRDVAVRGHLVLDPGASLDWYVTSFWSEDADKTSTLRGTLKNEGSSRLSEDVTARGTVPAAQVAWSRCTTSSGYVGLLNVNFRVALQQAAASQHGYFGKDPDTAPSETWGYVWRRC